MVFWLVVRRGLDRERLQKVFRRRGVVLALLRRFRLDPGSRFRVSEGRSRFLRPLLFTRDRPMQGLHSFDPLAETVICLESFVPKDHFLRKVDRALDLSFVRELTAAC